MQLSTLFPLGRLVGTRNVLQVIRPWEILDALKRHAKGDWGDLCADDRSANNEALSEEGRLLSVYKTPSGTKFWIITEADRSATTILLPDDY